VTRAVYRSQWFELLDAFQESDPAHSRAILNDMMKSARSTGVRRLADYSRASVQAARRAEASGRQVGAALGYDAALALDDSSFEAAACRVRFLGKRGSLRDAANALPGAFRTLFASSESRLSLLSSLVLAVVGALAAAAVAALIGLFFRHASRAWHDLRETAGRLFGHRAAAPVAFVLLVLPVFLALGPLWLLLYWAILAYGYSSRRERFVIAFALVALAVAPIAIDAVARENLVRRSPIYRAAVDLEERRQDSSVEDGLASLAVAYPEQPDAWFLLARYAERSGDNPRAVMAYGRAIQTDPRDYRALVNRGNVRFLEGEYSEAISDYEEAARRAPTSAEAFYNLSVARSEIYDFKGQEAARARALQISRSDVDNWSSSPPLSRVVPAAYRVAYARERARAWSQRSEGASRPALVDLALSPWCLAPLGALVAAWIFGAIRTRVGVATVCARCGRAFCRRCKRYGGPAQFCTRCVRLYARKEQADEAAREEDRLANEGRARRRRFFVKLGSAVAPGIHRFLAGRPWSGLSVLFLFFLLLVLVFGAPWLFDVAPLAPPEVSLPARIAAAALALALWLYGMNGAWRQTREP
jgi:tetratricopeptide (TPR) repeat protein